VARDPVGSSADGPMEPSGAAEPDGVAPGEVSACPTIGPGPVGDGCPAVACGTAPARCPVTVCGPVIVSRPAAAILLDNNQRW